MKKFRIDRMVLMKKKGSYPEQKNIDGIGYTLIRKRIKNAYIHIKPPDGSVLVTAPLRMGDTEINSFVSSRREWIYKNVQRMKNISQNKEEELKNSRVVYLWGKPYILEIRENCKKNSYEISDLWIRLYIKVGEDDGAVERILRKMYADKLKEALRERIPFWEEKTGMKCSSWSVRYMTSRWGSCNIRTHKLNFNTRLAEKDAKYLEYVILHELAHTRAADHGKRFKAILDLYMEDWRQIRRELNHT